MCALRLDLREKVFSQPGTSQRWTLTVAVERWGIVEGGSGGIFCVYVCEFEDDCGGGGRGGEKIDVLM